jgi:hypothetical protein
VAKFVILAADGTTIVSRGHCSDADVILQTIPPGGSILTFPNDTILPDDNQEYNSALQTFRPSLVNWKRKQAQKIKVGAYSYIQGGFTSSAKGAALIYDTSPTEQTNMLMSAFGGGGLMAKANAGGVFAPVAHTQAQARQVVAEFVAYRDAALTKLATLGASIRNASTAAEVQAIIWSPPA